MQAKRKQLGGQHGCSYFQAGNPLKDLDTNGEHGAFQWVYFYNNEAIDLILWQ